MSVKLNPISYKYHFIAAGYVKGWGAKTVVDVGGIGGLRQFLDGASVTDVNRSQGMDGRDMPYSDGQFDACVSINTLEHVGGGAEQTKFLKECMRVAKRGVMIFPFGPAAERVEAIKKAAGHNHACQVPLSIGPWPKERRVLTTCREHLLSLALAPTQLPRNAYLKMMVEHVEKFDMDEPYTMLITV